MMNRRMFVPLLSGLMVSTGLKAQATGGFDKAADAALEAMRVRAEELKIGGVAVVAAFEGDVIRAWSSKMLVVGRYKDEPKAAGDKGSNLLGIVYAKAAEMADTHKDSGSQVRPPMTGEFGWSGGVIGRTKTGWAIAAFSGGKSEDDVQVSHAGLILLSDSLRLEKKPARTFLRSPLATDALSAKSPCP